MPEEMDALKQMLEGVAFIHSRKYVHRDVKPNNILISKSGGLKIADFGFCKPVRGIDSFSMSNAGVGTGGWMAPELLKSIAGLLFIYMLFYFLNSFLFLNPKLYQIKKMEVVQLLTPPLPSTFSL